MLSLLLLGVLKRCVLYKNWVWAERRAGSCCASPACTQGDGKRYFHGFIYMDALCFAPLSTFGLKICMFCFHTTNKLHQGSLPGESNCENCVFKQTRVDLFGPKRWVRMSFHSAPNKLDYTREKTVFIWSRPDRSGGMCPDQLLLIRLNSL